MTKQDLFVSIGEVREEWIADAGEENLRCATRAKRVGRLARRLGAIAACLAILLVGGYRFINWYFPLGAHEQVLRLTPIVMHNRFMQYELVRLGDGQETMLPHRRGEYVGNLQGREVWRLRGREDYAELIIRNGEQWQLVRFNEYSAFAEGANLEWGMYADWVYATLLSPEEWAKIDTTAYTLGEVLHDIYAADSADDIAWVRFEKSGIDNTQVGQSVKVQTVTLRDAESITQVWEILVGLEPFDDFRFERPQPAVTKPDVLAVQTVRDVTVRFRNGAELTFEYNPAGGEDCGLLYRVEGHSPYYLTIAQNHTLIDLAGISFAPTPIPETDPPRGLSETATVRPPETAAPETIPE
ncbi:MAG: hypothetical protein IKD37_04430 [Clostridia bacterium]|nr:hypothetical protein [Clostridia bacterium]